MKNFTDYLETVFLEDYTGIKDDAEEAFDNWISNLDVQELIDYAEAFADVKVAEITNE